MFLPSHRKLTEDHVYLNTTTKMRNHLVKQVLDNDMLYLLHEYKKSHQNHRILDALLNPLKYTSMLINIFGGAHLIVSRENEQLHHTTPFPALASLQSAK